MRSVMLAAAGASLGAITCGLYLTEAAATDPFELVRSAITLPCQAAPGTTGLARLAERLPGARPQESWVRYSGMDIVGGRMEFEVADDKLTIQFSGQAGTPGAVSARYLATEARLPRLLAIADGSCTIHTARQLSYDAWNRPAWLQDLDSRLRPVGERLPLNPPVPAGANPPGTLVAVVDTGVNYLLPEIGTRLARDKNGEILGYDYFDLDRRPFDVAPDSDPFYPEHHGTLVASLLLAEAPVARLVPYRLPRGHMTRMAMLIEHAARRGVRVINLSLASQNRDEWLPFREAARTNPEMLFVVAAGNWGRDLAQQPAYPAALGLENAIVVTAAKPSGELAAGVNFGPRVDIMAPGEEILALNFDGVRRKVSGSSYATARISALATCLLAEHPEWTSAQLKAAILLEAHDDKATLVAQGFLPEEVLGNRGACRRTLACRGPGPAC